MLGMLRPRHLALFLSCINSPSTCLISYPRQEGHPVDHHHQVSEGIQVEAPSQLGNHQAAEDHPQAGIGNSGVDRQAEGRACRLGEAEHQVDLAVEMEAFLYQQGKVARRVGLASGKVVELLHCISTTSSR